MNVDFGVVAVSDSPEQAEELYNRTQTIVQDEARQAIRAPAVLEPS
jgi:hypothetical protein